MNKEKEKVFLSEKVIASLYTKGILKRDYTINGAFVIDSSKVAIMKAFELPLTETEVTKVVTKDGVSTWIEEWRALFPRGKNNNTGVPYKGDRTMCLKNMVKFKKDYGFTKEEIFEVTIKAIEEADRVNFEYFPAAHYFIHKQNVGSRLAQLVELHKEGGSSGSRGRTVI